MAFPLSVNTAIQHYGLLSKLEGILDFLAAGQCFTTYVPVAKALGMFSGGAPFADLLGETQVIDHQSGAPYRSSLITSSETGLPGNGYFNHLRSLGHKIPKTPMDELVFWLGQMGALNVTLGPAAIATAQKIRGTVP
jgi:hypothetical protein